MDEALIDSVQTAKHSLALGCETLVARRGAVDSTLLLHVLSMDLNRGLYVVVFRDQVLVLHSPVELFCQFYMLTLV